MRGDVSDSEIALLGSRLCSPFRTFSQRASEYTEAYNSGDQHSVQTVVNASFGELWQAAGGDALPWEEVAKLRLPTYSMGTVPAGALYLTASADVHKNRLNYVVRAWGARQKSWLIEAGELYGETDLEPVWGDLADLLGKSWGGLHIRRMFVDSGFRPGNATKCRSTWSMTSAAVTIGRLSQQRVSNTAMHR